MKLAHQTATIALAAGLVAAGAAAPAHAFTACQVTDTAGINDRGFNETSWKGIRDARDKLGIAARYLESVSETDYEPNINALVQQKCDLIVTVGFKLGEATAKIAAANPAAKFSIVDFSYDPVIPNVLGEVFAADQAAFLAGYLAAGMSKSGVIGTFGGMNIPPIALFMDGFARGAAYYNARKGAKVRVLGWDVGTREGLFTNNFKSLDDGRSFAQNLYDEGADIVMPVAGAVGLGSAALADELGGDKLKIIGVDADNALTNPEKGHVYLTSVMKRMDVTVLDAVKASLDGSFSGGKVLGTLENGGVGLAPFHAFDDAVPAALKAELAALQADIVSGAVPVR